jgi:hypothetical protein
MCVQMASVEEKERKYQQVLEVQGKSRQMEADLIHQLKEEVSIYSKSRRVKLEFQ